MISIQTLLFSILLILLFCFVNVFLISQLPNNPATNNNNFNLKLNNDDDLAANKIIQSVYINQSQQLSFIHAVEDLSKKVELVEEKVKRRKNEIQTNDETNTIESILEKNRKTLERIKKSVEKSKLILKKNDKDNSDDEKKKNFEILKSPTIRENPIIQTTKIISTPPKSEINSNEIDKKTDPNPLYNFPESILTAKEFATQSAYFEFQEKIETVIILNLSFFFFTVLFYIHIFFCFR